MTRPGIEDQERINAVFTGQIIKLMDRLTTAFYCMTAMAVSQIVVIFIIIIIELRQR